MRALLYMPLTVEQACARQAEERTRARSPYRECPSRPGALLRRGTCRAHCISQVAMVL
ncbi:hypothetical protein XCCB100_3292 [Xanthomonas campestris pv. campestris]|nr:hypothetical protein XCCB100_3292 [Xanthomonas campestris pv. campestris]